MNFRFAVSISFLVICACGGNVSGSSSGEKPSEAMDAGTVGVDASPDASSKAERCAAISREFEAATTDANFLSCTGDTDCSLVRNGICTWIGYVALNASGAAKRDALADEASRLTCAQDCGSGGGKEGKPTCAGGACKVVDP